MCGIFDARIRPSHAFLGLHLGAKKNHDVGQAQATTNLGADATHDLAALASFAWDEKNDPLLPKLHSRRHGFRRDVFWGSKLFLRLPVAFPLRHISAPSYAWFDVRGESAGMQNRAEETACRGGSLAPSQPSENGKSNRCSSQARFIRPDQTLLQPPSHPRGKLPVMTTFDHNQSFVIPPRLRPSTSKQFTKPSRYVGYCNDTPSDS